MYKKANLTLGLFDKDTKTQLIPMEEAYAMIDDILLCFGLENYTTIECRGHWTMRHDENGKGIRVCEPSIRIEIADPHSVPVARLCHVLALSFNQEAVMCEYIDSNVDFNG